MRPSAGDVSLYSGRAGTSAGVELSNHEIVVLGMADDWRGPLAIDHAVMADAHRRGAGARGPAPPGDRRRAPARRPPSASGWWHVLAKAEAGSTGRLRGHRHTMLDDSDVSATRHARAFVAGALAGLVGHAELFVSGGAEHQGRRWRRAGRRHRRTPGGPPVSPLPPTTTPASPAPAIGLEGRGLTKIFGSFKALDDVSIKVTPGSLHALLGENGAGKSTLVKCIMGYYRADAGAVTVDGHERQMANPRDAMALGIGMVYQHFTLVPAMTVAENLVMSRHEVPAVIDWAKEIEGLEAFMAGDALQGAASTPPWPTWRPASGRRLEILKQLYLQSRFLILDEPTSVLTPDEADEMLGLLKGMTQRRELTVLMISHKFREVIGFADEVTVLRKGRLAGSGAVKDLSRGDMAAMMIGDRRAAGARGTAGQGPARAGAGAEGADAPTIRRAARGSTSRAWWSRPARSSASPAFRATARSSWSRCWAASAGPRAAS